jgi:hypothetical protein
MNGYAGACYGGERATTAGYWSLVNFEVSLRWAPSYVSLPYYRCWNQDVSGLLREEGASERGGRTHFVNDGAGHEARPHNRHVGEGVLAPRQEALGWGGGRDAG